MQYGVKSVCVCYICKVKNKIQNSNEFYRPYFNFNDLFCANWNTQSFENVGSIVKDDMEDGHNRMRSVHRTLWIPSFLGNTHRNLSLLFRLRFRSVWRSEIYIKLKMDADAGVAFVSGVQIIYQGQWRQYRGKCACVYDVCKVKNKIENERSPSDNTSNVLT
jgi:hypothetical protein